MIKWTDLFKSDEDKCRDLIGRTFKRDISEKDNPFEEPNIIYEKVIKISNRFCKKMIYYGNGNKYHYHSCKCWLQLLCLTDGSEEVDNSIWEGKHD